MAYGLEDMASSRCPFCERIATGALLGENRDAAAFEDAYPISKGHALVVPRLHEPDYFALSLEVRAAMSELVERVRQSLEATHSPSGYNLGINIGPSAGQTVPHAHVHVIPRYDGDQDDPRGGIRKVLPEKASYWDRP